MQAGGCRHLGLHSGVAVSGAHIPLQQRIEIGSVVLIARRNKVGWKELEELFQISERHLRRYAEMSDKISQMSDQDSCTAAVAS